MKRILCKEKKEERERSCIHEEGFLSYTRKSEGPILREKEREKLDSTFLSL